MGSLNLGNNQSSSPKPIDFLKDVEFRRNVSGAFKSTTREQWQNSHSNKTNPPEVGKYNPLYKQLDADKKAVSIPNEPKHLGE